MTVIDSIWSWVPPWLIGVITMIVPAVVALLVYRWFNRRLIRLAGRFSPFLKTLLTRGQGPASVSIVIVVSGLALAGTDFPSPVTRAIGQTLLVGFVLSLGWAAAIALDIGVEIYLRRYRIDVDDNLLARKHVTQMRILQRVAKTLLVIFTAAIALMTFDSVRQYGVSLFASAGAAGIILGLAARPVLSNLLAGIQIAVTQPIRVEDQVIVEGEWGTVETITSTYVVVRIWDLRRMILPLTYFIEKPFQNWTYENTDLLGSVILHVDYTVPVDRLRQRLDQIVHESKLWDGKVAVLQVTDAPANMVELRALVSARNASQLWDLRCEVREKLIGFLQTECPRALPHERFEPADGPPCPEVSAGDDKMTGPAQPPRSDQPASSPVTSSATR
jgi:small-conductance mechanosensitive channel